MHAGSEDPLWEYQKDGFKEIDYTETFVVFILNMCVMTKLYNTYLGT